MDAGDLYIMVMFCLICFTMGAMLGKVSCHSAQPVHYTFAMDGVIVGTDCTRAVSNSCGWSLSGCSDGRKYECVTNLTVGDEGR